MSFFDSLLLGLLQGFTEFLPVSSSGHLALAERLLNLKDTPLLFDIFLHVASLTAVLLFYRKKIFSLITTFFKPSLDNGEGRKESIFIIISTLMTGIIVIFIKPLVEFLREHPHYLFITFLYTAILIGVSSKFLRKTFSKTTISLKDAIIIGLMQGIAVLPGISRSGSTISAALFRKIDGVKAVEYSFMLAIPAIVGAAILEIHHGVPQTLTFMEILPGFISSFISSLLALYLLVWLIKKLNFIPFSIYLTILSVISFIFIK